MKPWILLLVLMTSPALAEIRGIPTVTDGDTLRIGDIRIRLFGIDAPEGKQFCERGGLRWLCGQESAKLLRELVASQPLTCQEKSRDRYRRSVAVCTLPDGTDLGAAMTERGMAVAYRAYSLDYVGEEETARVAKIGLWAGNFIMPWDYRRR